MKRSCSYIMARPDGGRGEEGGGPVIQDGGKLIMAIGEDGGRILDGGCVVDGGYAACI